MRRPVRSTSLLGISGVCLGLWGACVVPAPDSDDDTEKRRDLAVSRRDLGTADLGTPVDLSTPIPDLSSGTDLLPTMDMARARDLSLPPDLSLPADLSVPPDLSVPQDLARPVDLALPLDLALPRDLAMPLDLSMPLDLGMPVDLSTPPDLFMPDAAHVFTCRGTDAPGMTYKLVTDSLLMPKSTGMRSYAYDFDGDGKSENQFKNLINVISLTGLNVQASVDAAVAGGAILQLASLTTSDLTASSCAGLVMVPAKATLTPPRFDGTDVLDKFMSPEATLIGSLTAWKLSTKDSKDLLPAEDSPLALHLSFGTVNLELPLHGLHVEGTVDNSATPLRIKNGALYGVIAGADIDMQVVPAIASVITNLINSDPMSADARALIGLFENLADPATKAKCMVPAMCCQTHPATCVILPQEIKDSPIGGVLAPDVQVFGVGGAWKPVPGGRAANGMSFGIGFTGVAASFP